MKREEVLFYMTNDKVHLYLVHKNKEIVKEIDTSSFFKFGEISDVNKCSEALSDISITGILKPKLFVLYNNNTNCDLEFLYRVVLESFNYSEIEFIKLNDVLREIKNDDNLVVFDKDYYTVLKTHEKVSNIDDIWFEPILIGLNRKRFLHFSDKDIIWHTFKSHFTNE